MSPLMLSLAAELTDAQADGDATSLAAIAWWLYGQADEGLAEIGRLRAAIHTAWNRPQEQASPAPADGRRCSASPYGGPMIASQPGAVRPVPATCGTFLPT
jgi:hypothetical protein